MQREVCVCYLADAHGGGHPREFRRAKLYSFNRAN